MNTRWSWARCPTSRPHVCAVALDLDTPQGERTEREQDERGDRGRMAEGVRDVRIELLLGVKGKWEQREHAT